MPGPHANLPVGGLQLDSPSQKCLTVTPSDTVDLDPWVRAIYVGVTGNVRVLTWLDDDVTFVAVPAGMILPASVKRVFAASTTATSIVGLA
jgi:hypothetical protein